MHFATSMEKQVIDNVCTPNSYCKNLTLGMQKRKKIQVASLDACVRKEGYAVGFPYMKDAVLFLLTITVESAKKLYR